MTRFAPLLILALALAGPAAAWSLWDRGPVLHDRIDWNRPGLQQQVDARLGVSRWRDPVTGENRTEPLAQARYTVSFVQQTDSGFRWAVSVAIEGGNLPREMRGPFGFSR